MRKIIAYFIKYPIYANAIIIITAIAGILSLTMMPKSFFPELPPNKIYINVSYPGASPQEIEHGITTRIEESLNGIEGVEEVTSTSSEISVPNSSNTDLGSRTARERYSRLLYQFGGRPSSERG